ncbi:unnamed protein product, partial [Vitis vinifera]
MNTAILTPASKFRPFRRRPSYAPITSDLNPYHILWRYQILEPDGDIVTYWNHVFLVTSLISLFLDPLYFFLPSVGGPACLTSDTSLGIVVTFFRTVSDLFYLLHMVMKFRTAFVAPSSRGLGRGELVMDAHTIAMRYLKSDFIIDLAATLPLPQARLWVRVQLTTLIFLKSFPEKEKGIDIVIWLVIPATKKDRADQTNNTLALIVLIQYVPRLFLIFPLNRRIIKTTGVVAKTAWAGAAYNLLLYMLASHVLGASWYLLSMGRQHACWKAECAKESAAGISFCLPSFLDCKSLELEERQYWMNATRVVANCDARGHDTEFKFGMFADAFTNDVASSKFIEKYLYCLWWGLKNLSSYGQTLETSIYIGETTFCIVICIGGLVLFSQLIGNMQTYLQSMTVRLEEWRVKRRDTEEWMRHRQLPPALQERVHRFVQYKWLATRGVHEESILHWLPLDLRREIQRHLCLGLVRRVPFFAQMDDQLLDAICERLTSSLSTEGTYIFREGDPVNEMLFIIRGQLESSTTNGGRSGFFNSITLRPGDFCGEELLTWALMPNPSINLPSSTRTVRSLCEVEAFALTAEDLKFVASQFRRLHNKKLQHAFRYYSQQWRTWGTCYLQDAWRRYKKRKLAKELARQESYNYMLIPDQERGVAQEVRVVEPAAPSLKMPRLLKPDEPDFSVGHEDV